MSPYQTPPRPHGRGGTVNNNAAQSPEQGCGELRPVPTTSTYGTELRTRRPGFIRLVSQNIDGMGFSSHSDKITRLKEGCDKYGIDVIGLQEMNVNWPKVRPSQTLENKVKGWKEEVRTVTANNTTDFRSPRHQYGGTALLAIDKMAHCYFKAAKDFRQLGRWSSMTFRGKGGKITRVVSCYCPVKPSSFHAGSVYTQHVEALQKSGIHRCPREQFWIDLKAAIAKWTEDDETLVVMGDFNHSVEKCNQYLAGTGLKDFITHTHGLNTAPATHEAGSVPIDAIFVSEALLPFIRGGYMGFGQLTRSDHRALWIELPMIVFIGYNMNDIIHPAARRLKLEDPRVVKKYQDTLHQLFSDHKVYEKLAKLVAESTFPLPVEQQKQYEKIDLIRMHCMSLAEKKCRRLHMGNIPFSAAYARSRDEIDLWTALKKRHQGRHCDLRKTLRLLRRLEIEDEFFPIEIIIKKLDDAWDTYRAVRKDGKKFRQDFVDGLAEAQAEAQNIPKKTALQNIQHREAQRSSARTVKYVLMKLNGGGTSMVVIIRNGETVEITTKEELEQALLHENEWKYHQTEGFSQLLSGPLLDDIGLLGEGPHVKNILNGSYVVPEGTNPGTKLYLAAMAVPTGLNRARKEFTLEDFKLGWKKMKERTSSHGMAHFGHYKAGCTHEQIAMVHYHMAELPFTGGYSPIRHRKGTDLVLLKSANDFRIKKLRTIVLFDAECNMNNGRMGKEAMHLALDNNLIAPEQYSRPNRKAIDHALNRRLMFDYFTMRKRPFSMTSCDLAGCYDRVIHGAISLALQRVGISQDNIASMCGTLQQMIHVVRTAFGDSTSTIGGEDWGQYLLPCMGMFQGNKAGPPIWAIISSTIFDALRKQGYGVSFCSAISALTFRLCGFAFVDDSDLIADGDTAEAAHLKMQETITCWEGIIAATGGAMAPVKSWWYLVDFDWDKGRWKFKNAGENRQLFAHDAENRRSALRNLSPSQATKMLGVYMAPDGNNTKQVEYMRGKAAVWGANILAGNLTQTQTYLATVSTIMKTLEYPLVTLDLSQEELRSITWPALKISLKKMGLHPCTSKIVRHGPKAYLGAGLTDPFDTQGVRRILAIVEQLWHRTPTGDLLITNLEALTLDIGICGSIFTPHAIEAFEWATTPNVWLVAAIKYACDHNFDVAFQELTWIRPVRQGDVSIMTSFCNQNYTTNELQRINRVRLWYKISLLSDLCTADGKEVEPHHLGSHGFDALGFYRDSRFDWAYQQRPPRADFKCFRDALQLCFCHDGSWILRSPLGAWDMNDEDYKKDWDWFYSPSLKNLLFLTSTGDFAQYAPISQRQRTRRSLPFSSNRVGSIPAHLAPPDLQRMSVTRDNPEIFTMINSKSRRKQVTTQDIPGDPIERFLFYMEQAPEAKALAAELETSPSIDTLITDFQNGDMVAVSDGSYYKDIPIGSAEWILTSADDSEYILGGGLCPGLPEQLNAYRSELWGILGLSLATWALEQTIGPTVQNVVVGCDGMSALTQSLERNPEGLTSRGKHFDMVAAIMGFWKNITASAVPTWVEGHMAQRMGREELPRLNRINEDRDIGAKRIAQAGANSPTHSPFQVTFKFGFAAINLHGDRIVSSAEKEILATLAKAPLQKYWLDKCEIGGPFRTMINWKSFKLASGRLPLHRQHFITNWMSRMTMVGSVARTRKFGHQYRCPRCNDWNETHSHVITCIQPKARHLRNTLLVSLKAWFLRNDTHPEIAASLYLILYEWSRRPSSFRLPFLYVSNNLLMQTIQQQNDIGWYNMLLGMQLKGWAIIQDQHYRSIPDCLKTGDTWASKLQFELWGIIWDMWQHRQEVRKEAPTAEDIVMQREARAAALSELFTGRRALPPLYTIYFTMSRQKLLEKSATDLRAWLRVIRGARESLGTYASDLFSENGPHRSWLGLQRRTSRAPRDRGTTHPEAANEQETGDHTFELAVTGGISL